MKWEKYYEHYFFDVNDMYKVDDFEEATGGPSEWVIDKNEINEHTLAIKQLTKINAVEAQSTYLTLKFKEFYDFTMCFAFLKKTDEGEVGAVFRY
jgi:hypothetical protein